MRDKLVVLGADHNGVELKVQVKKLLADQGYTCVDIGPYDTEYKVDYVDFAKTVGHIVDNGEARWGVLICGTGVGMSMAVNRFPNVRASLVHSSEVATKAREHNDANVLCLGAWVNSAAVNLEIVNAWFAQEFGEGRHVQRVEKMHNHSKDKIVFTNGIFDILHTGHVSLLKFAKSLGGRLIVGINSDAATRALKGDDRPINNQNDRKALLENLGLVDEVIIFDDTKSIDLILELKPDVVVKGGEWTADEVRRRDHIPDGIEVKIFPFVNGYSTTGIVKKIRAQAPHA